MNNAQHTEPTTEAPELSEADRRLEAALNYFVERPHSLSHTADRRKVR